MHVFQLVQRNAIYIYKFYIYITFIADMRIYLLVNEMDLIWFW